jgi:aminopeptidase N
MRNKDIITESITMPICGRPSQPNFTTITQKSHVLNRAQLLDDSFQLARGKFVGFDVPLSVIKYLRNEVDYVPWESGYNGIIQFKNWLQGTNAFDSYKFFIRNLVAPLFDRSGMEVIEYEHKFDRYVRSLSIQLACQFEVQECLDEVSKKLLNTLSGTEDISPDLQVAIYQNALRRSNLPTYEAMIKKLLSTEDQGQRTIMIASLGCAEDKELQKILLNLTIDPQSTLRRQEKLRAFNAFTNGGVAGLEGAIEFISEHHEKIEAIQEGRVYSMIRAIASRISSDALREKFSEMLSKLKANGKITVEDENRYLASASEIITWQNENADAIRDWLDANGAAYKLLPSIGVMMIFIFARMFL